MRAIAFVQRLVEQGRVDPGSYKDLRLHMVADEAGLAPLHPSSKLNTDAKISSRACSISGAWPLRTWLAEHRDDIGRRSTLDVAATFLAPRRAETSPK